MQSLLASGFTRYWDDTARVPYAYNSATHQFLSYEDPESLQAKCAFVMEKHLGGVMFWQYFSDPSGTLLSTLHKSLYAPSSGTHP